MIQHIIIIISIIILLTSLIPKSHISSGKRLASRAKLMYQFAIIGQNWPIANISVSVYIFSDMH